MRLSGAYQALKFFSVIAQRYSAQWLVDKLQSFFFGEALDNGKQLVTLYRVIKTAAGIRGGFMAQTGGYLFVSLREYCSLTARCQVGQFSSQN